MLGEIAFFQSAVIQLAVEFYRKNGGRLNGQLDLDLIQRAGIETAEPPRQLPAQFALGRQAAFQSIARPMIRAGRNGNVCGDLKWRDKSFAFRSNIELKTVAALQSPVDWRDEDAIAFPVVAQIGDESEKEFVKHLSHAYQPPLWTRLVFHS